MKKIVNKDNYIIDIDADVYHCLSKFEVNNVGTLLVMKGNVVVGTVTDGDIRKALINNRLMSIPVKHIMKNDYLFGLNNDECIKIFEKYSFIFMVPLVDEKKQLITIYLRDI
jgi:mannose-1-phosphate guanylyltransferase / mannose-6-phosphate isomerase